MLIGQEAGVYRLDIVQTLLFDSLSQQPEHDGRDIHCHNALADRRRGKGKDPCTGAKIDHGAGGVQAKVPQCGQILGGINQGLAIVARDVPGIEVLVAGMCELVVIRRPILHSRVTSKVHSG